MRVLYFVQYFPPEKAAGMSLVSDMINGFAEAGDKVTVYTPVPTRGVNDEIREYYKKHKSEKRNENLIIKRMSLYKEKSSFIQRTVRYTIFSLECVIKGFFISADAIFLSSGPPSQAVVVALLRKLTKKKIIYNLQDIFPDSLIKSNLIHDGTLLVKIGRWMERLSYKYAHSIITVSENMLDVILKRGAKKNKTFLIHNWVDNENYKPVSRDDNVLFDTLNLDRTRFYLVYSGNIGYTIGLEYVIQAMEKIEKTEDMKLLIFGEGVEKEKLQNYVRVHNVSNVLFFPFQSENLISSVYSIGNIAIISGKKGISGVSMPSKTWTIMATGTGILAQFDRNSELETIIRSAKCGIVIKPEAITEIADTIRWLYNNREACAVFGKNARKYAEENLDKETAISKYIKIIHSCI